MTVIIYNNDVIIVVIFKYVMTGKLLKSQQVIMM